MRSAHRLSPVDQWAVARTFENGVGFNAIHDFLFMLHYLIHIGNSERGFYLVVLLFEDWGAAPRLRHPFCWDGGNSKSISAVIRGNLREDSM